MDTSPSESEVISLDDSQLIELVQSARRKIFFCGPGMSLPVAKALCEQWIVLGGESVSVLLDVDAETCRLGYSFVEAVKLLHDVASQMGRTIQHRPGLRIGILISDDITVVYSPVPLLIESESGQFPRPNAVRFGPTTPDSPAVLQQGAEDLIQGSGTVGIDQLDSVNTDLAANPPLRFDLAHIVTVFNARIEFVEFELTGLSISRRRVPIPSDLLGLAKDAKTQNLLHSTVKLIAEDSELSGQRIYRRKKVIADHYLVPLKGYGTSCFVATNRLSKIQFRLCRDAWSGFRRT